MDLFRSPGWSAYVKKLMERHHVPGLAIAVVQDDMVASAGFGKASLDPPQDCTPDTIFDIASASKSLTAAAVALLVSDNDKYPQVQYETTMASLLPDDFVMPGKDHGDVTVEDILSHRTGMPGHDSSYMGLKAAQPDDARSITRNLRNLSVAAPNRAEYMYCNMMYTVAAYLVERMSGLPFADFLEQRVFAPLAMDSTNLQPERARAKGLGARLATGHFWDAEAAKYRTMRCCDSPEAAGAGSVMTSANDYIKWVRAMIKHDRPPITDSVYKGLIRTRIAQEPADEDGSDGSDGAETDSPNAFYAVGWQVGHYCGHMIVSHGGADDGFRTNHFFLPGLGFGGVIFGNADGASAVSSILTQKLIDERVQMPRLGKLLGLKTPVDSESDADEPWSGSGPDDEASEKAEMEAELRQELCPGITAPRPLTTPLAAYTGTYANPGYRRLRVANKDGALFVDASDRSMGFTLTFEHVAEQTKFIAHMGSRFEGGDMPIKAEFVLDKAKAKAVRMGLQLEERLEDYIWFDRVAEE